MQLSSRYLWGLLASILVFIYTWFMMKYLTDAKTCDKYLKKKDQEFRKAALVITWISLVLSGLSMLGFVWPIVQGLMSPVVSRGGYAYSGSNMMD